MSKLTRISITLPREVLAAADREAKRLDRSRSWVVAEAVRRYAGEPGAGSGQIAGPAPPAYAAAEVAEARRRHLAADLRLSLAERLRHAEELVQLAWHVHGRRHRAQVIGFDSYEDFYEWKRKAQLRVAGPRG
jgi:hypothetical protein